MRSDWLHVDNFVHAHALAMASLLPESAGSGDEERREAKGKSGQAAAAPPAAGKVYFITDGECSALLHAASYMDSEA